MVGCLEGSSPTGTQYKGGSLMGSFPIRDEPMGGNEKSLCLWAARPCGALRLLKGLPNSICLLMFHGANVEPLHGSRRIIIRGVIFQFN